MKILRCKTAPRYRRSEGITSYLLASPRTCGSEHLTTTWVEIEPGGTQHVHDHPQEQVYFIVDGHGRMSVGGEMQEVGPADCVFIPGGTPHGLENDSAGMLRYFSAAAPAFSNDALDALWPLPNEADEESPC